MTAGEGASRADSTQVRPHVTVVVVAHNGARWLPRVLGGLAAQTRPPDQTVLVDAASQDASRDIAVERLGATSVIHTRRDVGVGAAVGAALRHAHPGCSLTAEQSWVWLLHDDSVPAPDALDALLHQVDGATDIGVIGPKLREWPSLRRLLEVGVTISGTGRRETGLEGGEPDQGQHDRPHDVLAVSSAGMLVRRDVWTALSGFDPRLPLFGDDIDFGWRANRAGYRVRVAPAAVVFHAEAASRGLRGPNPVREQRRAALYTLLVNASTPGVVWQFLRLLVGSLLRILGLLVVKAPGQAWHELLAVADVYLRPWHVVAGRRSRGRTARRPAGELRPLLPSPTLPYRRGIDALLEAGRALLGPKPDTPAGRRIRDGQPGPVPAEVADTCTGAGPLARHSYAVMLVALTGFALSSAAGLLGDGLLQGGALLPAPDSVGRWWSLYVESWHPVGIGSDATTPPYVLALALAGTAFAGQAWLLVDVVLLAAVPLCAVTSHRLARRLFGSRRVQLWWSLTYALVPVATGAVGQGRLGTVVGAATLPVVVDAALALVLRRSGSPAWQQAIRLGLWLSLLCAFVPIAFPVVGSLLVVGASLTLRGGRWLAVVAALFVPVGLLGPWLWTRWSEPSLWWWEAGLPDAALSPSQPDVADLLGAAAGGPAHVPGVFALGLLAVALLALLRADRQRGLLMAWLVALTGLAVAVAGSSSWVDVPTRDLAVPAWVGFPLVCWWGGLAAAAGMAADGASEFLERHPFGWRQPVAVAATALGVFVTLGTATWWVVDTGTGVLRRAPATPLPDYLTAAAAAPNASSALVVSGSLAGGVTYELVLDDGTRLGEETVVPTAAERASFDATVAAVLGDPSPAAVAGLANSGVGAVYATPPVDAAVAGALDAAPGFQRSGAPDTGALAWQLASGAGSVRVVPRSGVGSPAGVAEVNVEYASSRPWAVAALVGLLVVGVLATLPRRRGRR